MSQTKSISHILLLLRLSFAIVYIWFGALKFFPTLSPAEVLAEKTIAFITFGLINGRLALVLLAIWETVLGVLLVVNRFKFVTYRLLLLHLACTFVPLFFFAELSFTQVPYGFTLVGQYIVKNVVFIMAAVLLMKLDPAVSPAKP